MSRGPKNHPIFPSHSSSKHRYHCTPPAHAVDQQRISINSSGQNVTQTIQLVNHGPPLSNSTSLFHPIQVSNSNIHQTSHSNNYVVICLTSPADDGCRDSERLTARHYEPLKSNVFKAASPAITPKIWSNSHNHSSPSESPPWSNLKTGYSRSPQESEPGTKSNSPRNSRSGDVANAGREATSEKSNLPRPKSNPTRDLQSSNPVDPGPDPHSDADQAISEKLSDPDPANDPSPTTSDKPKHHAHAPCFPNSQSSLSHPISRGRLVENSKFPRKSRLNSPNNAGHAGRVSPSPKPASTFHMTLRSSCRQNEKCLTGCRA